MVVLLTVVLQQSAGAQVKITNNDYPLEPGLDSVWFDQSGASIPIPEKGPNKQYDYSGLIRTSSQILKILDGGKHSVIKGATHKHRGDYTIQGYDFRTFEYVRVDADGYSTVGRAQFDTSHSLILVTGNANDIMHFPDYDQEYTHPRTMMKFPFAYEDEWSGMDIQVTKFDITVAAFGLNQVPGEIVRRRYQKREVVGYGELTIPDGEGGKSLPINVLLVNTRDSIIDSVFLAGQPAPTALLDAFKFTQGRTKIYETYSFEMRGLGRQPLGFVLDQNGVVDYTFYRPRAARLVVGAPEINIGSAAPSIYPTQVQSGGVINVSEGFDNAKLTSLDGKTHVLVGNGTQGYHLSELQSGMYVLQLSNKLGTLQATEKITVIR